MCVSRHFLRLHSRSSNNWCTRSSVGWQAQGFTYHVGLQEGPALCLKRLSADLETLQQSPHELTSIDLAEGATTCSQGDRPRVWRCLPENTFRSGRLGPQT